MCADTLDPFSLEKEVNELDLHMVFRYRGLIWQMLDDNRAANLDSNLALDVRSFEAPVATCDTYTEVEKAFTHAVEHLEVIDGNATVWVHETLFNEYS